MMAANLSCTFYSLLPTTYCCETSSSDPAHLGLTIFEYHQLVSGSLFPHFTSPRCRKGGSVFDDCLKLGNQTHHNPGSNQERYRGLCPTFINFCSPTSSSAEITMPQCQFIYLRRHGDITFEGRCKHEALFLQQTMCSVHKYQRATLSDTQRMAITDQVTDSLTSKLPAIPLEAFPRVPRSDEIRTWVNAARAATDPFEKRQRARVFCGQLRRVASELYDGRARCYPSI
jgi:hypothetical protein